MSHLSRKSLAMKKFYHPFLIISFVAFLIGSCSLFSIVPAPAPSPIQSLPGLTPLQPLLPVPSATKPSPLAPAPIPAPIPAPVPAPVPAPIQGVPGLTPLQPAVQAPQALPPVAPLGVLPGLTPLQTSAPVAVARPPQVLPGQAPLQAAPLSPPVQNIIAPLSATPAPGFAPVPQPTAFPIPIAQAPVQYQPVEQVLEPATMVAAPIFSPNLPNIAAPAPGALPVPAPTLPQKEAVEALESVALQAFPEGTRVAILFVGQGKEAQLLKVTRGIYVAPIGNNPFDPKCQFVVMRKGNWIGFKSEYLKDRVLQSDLKSLIVHFPDANFNDDKYKSAHWAASFINSRDSSSIVRLQNRDTQGFLNFPSESWAEGLAWTALTPAKPATSTAPASPAAPATIAGELARLRLVKVSGLPKDAGKETGSKDYVYTPRLHKKFTPVYNQEGWKFQTPGTGYVIFDARAKESIVVSFATVADNLTDNMYCFVIGDQKNTQTTIRKSVAGSIFYKLDTAAGASKNVVITAGVSDQKAFDSYWLKVDNGVLTYGKGRSVGQNELLKWTDPGKALKVQFIGFAGGNSKVDFKNIEIGGKEKIAAAINLPIGFSQEAGSLKRIAVGSRKGDLVLWGIGADGSLMRWKTDTITSNPWESQKTITKDGSLIASFQDISLSSDGNLIALSTDGVAYSYDWDSQRLNVIDTGMQRLKLRNVSVGHGTSIWAVGHEDGRIYQLVKKSWQACSDAKSGKRVAACLDAVFALSEDGKVYRYAGNKRWIKIPSKASFIDLAAVNKELIFAIDRRYNIWQYTPSSNWAPVAGQNKQRSSGCVQIAANAAGTIALLDSSGNIYKARNVGVPENKVKQMVAQSIKIISPVKKQAQKKLKKNKSGSMKKRSPAKRLKKQPKKLKKASKKNKKAAQKKMKKRKKAANKKM